MLLEASWNEERAGCYYLMLPQRARRSIREPSGAAAPFRPAALRDNPDDSLRGHSAPLSLILQRGKVLHRWPASIEQRVKALGPGFGRVEGYEIPAGLIDVFEAAVRNVEDSRPAQESAGR
ncbi:hypothetical protein ACWDSD_35215 [Streptomyces spiralis]